MRLLDPATVDALRAQSLTYPRPGPSSGLPPGYASLQRRLGLGVVPLEPVASALLGWRVHERAGLSVAASGPVAMDAVVVLVLGVGPLRVHAPCRVVAVDPLVAGAARVGFAYGTLPGHPEAGEESFVLERAADGTVTFTISAFSRPARLSTRVAGPLGRVVQAAVTERYLRAAARIATSAG